MMFAGTKCTTYVLLFFEYYNFLIIDFNFTDYKYFFSN